MNKYLEILKNANYSKNFIFENDVVNYIEIANFHNINFVYGISIKGWIVFEDNVLKIISFETGNFSPFLKTLEINYVEFKRAFEEEFRIKEVFPIFEILKLSFNAESCYWSNLSLDFLINIDFINNEIICFLSDQQSNKWTNQNIKQKIFKIITRSA